jgi:hypothetical protein
MRYFFIAQLAKYTRHAKDRRLQLVCGGNEMHVLQRASIAFLTILTFSLTGCGGGSGSTTPAPPAPFVKTFTGATESVVNTQVSTDWSMSKPISLTNGNTLISWLQGSALGTVQAQLYTPAGAKVGNVITITDYGIEAEITPLSTGGFAAIWYGSNYMYGQVFDAAGGKLGAQFKLPTYGNYKSWISIASLSGGRFVVGWVDIFGADTAGYGINAQIYDANGLPTGTVFGINSVTTGNQELPDFASLTTGGFVATWCNNCNSSSSTRSTISAQAFDANGIRTGSQVDVSSDMESININSRATGLSNGGFAVVWEELKNWTGTSGITKARLQMFSPAGTRIGAIQAVSETGNQAVVELAGLENGYLAVLYQNGLFPMYPGRFKNLNVQIFNDKAIPQSAPYAVNMTTPSDQYVFWPNIGALSNGGFVASWKEYNGISGQSNGGVTLPDFIETTKTRFYVPN